MNENKGLAGEILNSDTHLAELKKLEERLESERAVQYEFYGDLQKKLHLDGLEPEVRAKYTAEKDNAFFKHMSALHSYRCNVHLLNDFEDIRSLSSSDLSPSLTSVLEKNNNITDEYIHNIAQFMDDQARLSRSISALETTKQLQEKQIRSLSIYKVSAFLSNPLSGDSKKEITELKAEIVNIDEGISTLRSNFDKQWHHVFNDYSKLNQEKLDELKKRHHLYQRLHSALSRMEASVTAFPIKSLGDSYEQFKQHRSQYNLMKFSEEAIKNGYAMHLKIGDNPLAEVIPTLRDLYPTLSKDLSNLDRTLQKNLANSRRLNLLLSGMKQKNEDIIKEIQKSELSKNDLHHKIKNLPTQTDLSLLLGPNESEELIKKLKNELENLTSLKRAYVNRQPLINKLKNFLDYKTGGNLSALYRSAQQDRESSREKDTVAGCLETSYPKAIRQLLDFDQQKIVRIQNRADLVVQYHQALQKRKDPKSGAKPKECELAASLNEFITGQQNWKQLSALQNAIDNYSEYYKKNLYKNLIDTIMNLCADPVPFPQYYVPAVINSHPSIQSNQPNKTVRYVDEVEPHNSTGIVAEEPLSLSTDYTAFMACAAEINKEKMKSKESQNLGPLYNQRYALFERYMNEEFDARGRQRARHHIILRLSKQEAKPIVELCQNLDDKNPIKWRLFNFLMAPTWYSLDDIKLIIAHHPKYYKDEKLEAILSSMMAMLLQSVESARSNAINNHLGNQGHFTRRAIQQQNQALHQAILAHNKLENVSNDAQWKAINTIGERLKDTLQLLMQQPGSPDYVRLLADIKTFVKNLIARQVNQSDFQAIQDSLKTLTAATNPVRIATEFLLISAQKTQEFKPKSVDVDQQMLHANIEKILSADDPENNADKWNTIVMLYLLLDQFTEKSQDQSLKGIFAHCINYLEALIGAIKDGYGDLAQITGIFDGLYGELARLNPEHAYYHAVQLVVKIIKETDEYEVLLNPPSLEVGA